MSRKSRSKLSRDFFARPTVELAPELLGMKLCRRLADGSVVKAEIVEVEAYTADDPACHAWRGKTKRCEVMFGPPGFSYVYFIYGMYNCLNVVTEPDGTAGAILIRAIGVDGGNGPGKLCKTWEINREHNGIDLLNPDGELFLEDGRKLDPSELGVSIRVGISVAQENLWRFFVKGHPYISVANVKAKVPKKKKRKADGS